MVSLESEIKSKCDDIEDEYLEDLKKWEEAGKKDGDSLNMFRVFDTSFDLSFYPGDSKINKKEIDYLNEEDINKLLSQFELFGNSLYDPIFDNCCIPKRWKMSKEE